MPHRVRDTSLPHLRVGAGQLFQPGRGGTRARLPFGGVIIAAGVITYGAVMVAVRGAPGAGEILDRPTEIGFGVAQAFGRAGVAKAARGAELDLHQPDIAVADE